MKEKYIDFHAHILPCIDHGSDSTDVSLKQLDMAELVGIGCIVATPHFYPYSHSAEKFLKLREKAYTEISAASNKKAEIICGAEVLLCEGLNNLPELEKLCIGDSNTILVEMPGPPWTKRLVDTLMRISEEHGLEIVLAHVDRYDAEDIEGLFSIGLHGQLNASAFNRVIGQKKLFKWIDEGYIIALGSDIHGLGDEYKYYSKAMQTLGRRGEILQKSMSSLLSIKS